MPVRTLPADAADASSSRPSRPALKFRNHNHEGMTTVSVTVTDQTGETVHEDTYTLAPQVAWRTAVPIAPGSYSVSAAIPANTAAAECRVDDHGTVATIELGNGAVSVADSQ